MKGMVFTEFLDMVDDLFGETMTERIVLACDLPSGGAYTATGNYDHREMLSLVAALHRETGHGVQALCRSFGSYLFARFTRIYPQFFEQEDTAFSFLDRVEHYIHVEVRKLYPDAKLPSIRCRQLSEHQMELTYRSHRCLAPVCHGLILGCCEHFRQKATVESRPLGPQADGDTVFTISFGEPPS